MSQKIAIIGGGIVGATTAFYLTAMRQHSDFGVTLFDDDTGQATKAAAGIISPWLSKRRNKKWYALAKLGAEFYETLVADAQLSHQAYQQTGTIVTRKNPEDLATLFKTAQEKLKSTPAMKHVALLPPEAVSKQLPFLTNAPAGIFVAGGAKIDGRELVSELLTQSQAAGLKIIKQRAKPGSTGRQICFKDKHNGLHQESFDRLIITTGAWMKETLAAMPYEVHIRPQKGQLLDFKLRSAINLTDLPVLMPEGQSDIIPFNQQQLVVGATHENDGGFDLTATAAAKTTLLSDAQSFDRQLSAADVAGTRIGTRAYTDDFAPFFGRLPLHPWALVAGGLGSSGLTTGPIIGYLLAKSLIVTDSQDSWQRYTKPVVTYITPRAVPELQGDGRLDFDDPESRY